MSASAPTMKTFHKRLYTVLPRGVSQAASASASTSTSVNGRLRSNSSSSSSRSFYTASSSSSLSAFFADGPPPTPSPARPQLSSTRLPIEAKGQVEGPPSPTHHHHHHNGHQSSQSSTSSHGPAPPSSIALTSPPANGSSPFGGLPPSAGPFFPYTPFNPPPVPSPAPSAPLDAHAHHQATSKRPGRHRYHFDVGAYGIPKRSRTVVSGRDGRGSHHSSASRWTAPSPITDALDLAVQVGEDAYFVRENAMGVADGVGGWSRALAPTLGPSDPSPSALFARRLMHFCSAEVASLSSAPTPSSSNANSATFAFHEPAPPQPPPYVPFFPGPGFTSWHEPYVPTYLAHPHHPHHVRADPLAAVVEEDDPDAAEMDELEEGLDVLLILERAYARALEAHVAPAPAPAAPPSRPPSPALFRAYQDREKEKKTESVPLMTGSSTALLAVLDSAGAGPHPHPAPEVSPPSSAAAAAPGATTVEGCDAVLRIAHLGDCMGMLVRDEEIVWRSDEMWWSFNTPLQLGPASRTPPTSAQILTLPVRADDILILASDGLSDNLWDEDVLDEVVRFRRARNLSSTTTTTSSDQNDTSRGAAKPSALGRRTLAGMLSEALCSRARMVSERRTTSSSSSRSDSPSGEVPFARRAREEGRSFAGGKADDISVLVAVISPAEEPASAGVV